MATFPKFEDMWQEATPYFEHQILADNESVSWRNQVVTGANSRLKVKLRTRPLEPHEDREMSAFINNIHGRGLFEWDIDACLPCLYEGNDSDGTFTNTTALAIGADRAEVAPRLGAISDFPRYGYFQFSNHDKIYQVVSHDSDIIIFSPSLYAAVPADTTINIKVREGQFRLEDGSPTSKQSFIYRTEYEFTFCEELPRT